MKSTFLTILLSCALLGHGQQLSGVISNAQAARHIYFRYSTGLSQKTDSTIVSRSGHFIKKFRFAEPKFVVVSYGSLSKQVYLFPGGSFELKFDATNKNTFNRSFIVKGDHLINKYLDSVAETQPH